MYFSGEKSEMQWKEYLLELQATVKDNGRGAWTRQESPEEQGGDCENKELVNGGAMWVAEGMEQRQLDRAAGVRALRSMLAVTTSGRARELVMQGRVERDGMVTFGRLRERFGQTPGDAGKSMDNAAVQEMVNRNTIGAKR